MAKQSGWTHTLSLDLSDTLHCFSLLHVNYSPKSFTPVNPSFFLVHKKEAKLTFDIAWSFVSADDLLYPWRQAVSQLLLNVTRIKIRSKGRNLERYLQQWNRDPPLMLAGGWFKSYQNSRERPQSCWLKVQRWLRKIILEKRCQVVPLGRKYWVTFGPQRYTQLSVTSTEV